MHKAKQTDEILARLKSTKSCTVGDGVTRFHGINRERWVIYPFFAQRTTSWATSVWATSEKGNSKNERMSVSDPWEKIEWGADSEPRKNERVPSSDKPYTATKIPLMYSFSGNSAASAPISTFICLWAIYIVLYIYRIGLNISSSRTGRPIVGIYHSQTHGCGNWDWDPNIPFLGICICFEISVFCLCSVLYLPLVPLGQNNQIKCFENQFE